MRDAAKIRLELRQRIASAPVHTKLATARLQNDRLAQPRFELR
jgi:hypothetical protein